MQADRPRRRPYVAPELTKVQVRLDEAVLIGCKNSGAFARPGGDCGIPTTPCSEAAS
jgi:hypothetical protein